MKDKIDMKHFLLVTLGSLIVVAGLYFFLVPSDLAVGGVTGLGVIFNHIFPQIPIGIIMGIFNIILFTLAFAVIGRDFGGYTVYSSFTIAIAIYILEMLVPMDKPLVDDLFLNLIYGIVIQGIGMAIVFNQETSTGGTDIIAKIINKFFHLDIGKSLFLADFIIVSFAASVFGLELGMYALLGILLNSLVVDHIIAGFGAKIKIIVISKEEKQISRYIIDEIGRGVTLYHGTGGYSKEEKRIINTVVSRGEYIKIREYIHEVDPKAFMWVNFVNEVFGEGFTH